MGKTHVLSEWASPVCMETFDSRGRPPLGGDAGRWDSGQEEKDLNDLKDGKDKTAKSFAESEREPDNEDGDAVSWGEKPEGTK